MRIAGLHNAQGSRDGWGEVAPMARIVVSFEYGAFDEVSPYCFKIWRDIHQWVNFGENGEHLGYDADAPAGLTHWPDLATARANARAQWPRFLERHLAQPSDAAKITNEIGGSDRWHCELLCAFEDEIQICNEEAGSPLVLCVGSMAGDSPHWDSNVFQEVFAPHIVKAWERGNIYIRNSYTGVNGGESCNALMVNPDGTLFDNNVKRPFKEIDWFIEHYGDCGAMIIGESGYVTYPGRCSDYNQPYPPEDWYVTNLRNYDNWIVNHGYDRYIGGHCMFTYGEWWDANIEGASIALKRWFQDEPTTKWIPKTFNPDQPIDPPPNSELEERVERLEEDVDNLQQQVAALWQNQGNIEEILSDHDRRISALEGNNPTPPETIPPPDVLSYKVIDVSGWNNLDIDKLDISGAIIRTSNGINKMPPGGNQWEYSTDENGVDKYLWRHLENARKAGVPYGLYHFCHKDFGTEQIDHFIGLVEEAIAYYGLPSLGLWLDFENTSPEAESEIQSLCQRLFHMERWSLKKGIYTGAYWWNPRVPASSSWPCQLGLHIWTANYVSNSPISEPPPASWRFATPHHWKAHTADFWQFTSQGGQIVSAPKDSLDVNYYYGFSDRGDCGDEPIDPPTGLVVDMMTYYAPEHGAYAPITILKNNWGANDERQQIQTHLKDGMAKLYVTKNSHIEVRHLGVNGSGDEVIFFELDDSPGNGKYYRVSSPDGWIPRYFREGASFLRREDVEWFAINNCQPTGESSHYQNTIKFVEFFDEYTTPHGIVFRDVVQLQWLVGGRPEENYFLAPHVGYMGWQKLDGSGRESWVSEFITNQGNNTFGGSCYWPAFGQEYPKSTAGAFKRTAMQLVTSLKEIFK